MVRELFFEERIRYTQDRNLKNRIPARVLGCASKWTLYINEHYLIPLYMSELVLISL